MNIFEVVNQIYKKEPLIVEKIDITLCITLINILRLNQNNLTFLKKIIQYLFFIESKHFLMLLFVFIPLTKFPPYLKGIKKIEVKENKLYDRIGYLFDWSSKELEKNKSILNKVINIKFWEKELSLK